MQRYLFLCCLGFLSFGASGQKAGDELFKKYMAAAECYDRKSYDSALQIFKVAIDYSQKNALDSNYLTSDCYYYAGLCYEKNKQPQPAHDNLYKALQLSRKYHHTAETSDAVTAINQLHWLIAKNDWEFPYAAFITTIPENVVYTVEKAELIAKDSFRISIYGGKYDGIRDSLTGKVYTGYNKKMGRQSFIPLGSAHIIKLTNNRTIATVAVDPGDTIVANDLVYLKTDVPVSVDHSVFRKFLLSSVFLVNNYKEKNYERRYFFHYYDSLLDNEVLNNFKVNIDEIADLLKDDTSYKHMMGTEGIFKNEPVIEAMSRSTKEHLKLFLDFVSDFPGNYCGNDYKFSETYATWVINNAPLNRVNMTEYLTKRTADDTCRTEMKKLLSQIAEQHAEEEWINTGIKSAYTENVKQARSQARLLAIEGVVQNKLSPAGWSSYILAICEYKNGNNAKADSLLHVAMNQFKLSGDKEGETWTASAFNTIKSNSSVSLYVQGGHLMSYILAMSANPRYFATAGYDNLIKIWDIFQAKEVKTIAAHNAEIFGLSFSKDGRYMVSTSADTTIKIWNAYDYTLLKTIKAKRPQIVAAFIPGTRKIVSGGRDSAINFWRMETGELERSIKKHKGKVEDICFDPTDANVMLTAGTDSMVFQWTIDSMVMTHWFKERGKVYSVKLSPDAKFMSTVTSDTMINIWDYPNSKAWHSEKVSFNNNVLGAEDYSPDGRFLVFSAKGNKMKIIDLIKEFQTSYKTDAFFPLESVHFSKDGNFLIQKFAPGGVNKIVSFTDFDVNHAPDLLNGKDLKLYTNPPVVVQFSKDDKKLYICSNNLTVLDMATGRSQMVNAASQIMTPDPFLVLNNEAVATAYELKKPVVYFYNYETKDTLKTVYLDSPNKVHAFCMDRDEKFCYLGGTNGIVRGWDVVNNKIVFTQQLPHEDDESGISFIRIDSFRHCVYAVGDYQTIYILDPQTGAIKDSLKGSDVIPMKDWLYVAAGGGELLKLNATDHKLIKKIKIGSENFGACMITSSDYEKIVIQKNPTDIAVLDTKTDKVVNSFYDHDFGTAGMHISHDNKVLATGGFDNKINLYNMQTGAKLATIYTPLDEDPVIGDPQGHYLASKKSLDGIVFNYNNNAYGFEQFDLQFNRPDIILKELNRADDAVVQSYYTAYQKRLKRSGLSDKQMNNEIHLPVTNLEDKYSFRPTTTLPEYELNISCYDSKYKLQSLHILVNNNPVFGAKGKDLTAENASSLNEKIKIPLSTGNNQIRIYCVNEKGTSSLKESFDVLSNYVPKEKPNTYFIGIAVANYKDSSMSLRYSAKDVRDLAASFKKMYPNAIIDTLIDKQATKENILALKQELMKTNVNDKVVLAVTGHGLLSDSLDFYYGTYNVDFKNPELLGLKYEQLEGLLDDIPARQKLLLIDACHSGALDKETLLALKQEERSAKEKKQTTAGVNLYASRGGEVSNKEAKLDANNTFDLMQNQFADLTGSNGTVVISAAGGLEFAFESEKWNNGVFTYCVRKAIEEGQADKEGGNFDGDVTVQEVLNYVSKKVTELTNGNQRPSSRRENLEYDWRVK